MKPSDLASRPIQLTPRVWLGLLLVALLGLHEVAQKPIPLRTLEYLEAESPVILRTSDTVHRFPILGVEVELNDGWSYLSISEDVRAAKPTFVHEKSHSIIRLEPFRLQTWPPSEVDLIDQANGQLVLTWARFDDRWLGRLEGPDIDLMLLVMNHQPVAELNREVQNFCDRIRILAEN